MKNLLFLALFIFLGLVACKQDQSASIDLNMLQKNMDADQEVAKLRTLLNGQTRLLASITPAEIDDIHAKFRSCNLNSSTAPIAELETCLAGMPSATNYTESLKLERQYTEQYKVVERRFPDFAQLSSKKQAELLVHVNEAEAEKVLNDYLSKTKN